MTVLLDAPLTTDPDEEPASCAADNCDATEDLLPGPSGDLTCLGHLTEWASNPDCPYYDRDLED